MAAMAAMPALADWSGPPGSSGGGGVTVGAPISGTCPNGDVLFSSAGVIACEVVSGTGTVTGVSWAGGIIAISNPTTTPAFTISGTSGGVPYFSSASTWASSALLAANSLMIGGGAGAAPSTTTTGAGVLTALGAGVNATTGLPNVDGAITTGDCLKWGPGVQDAGAACGSGGSGDGWPAYLTGDLQWVKNPLETAAQTTGSVGVANQYLCTPFFVKSNVTVKALALRVIATSTGNSSVALQGALYNDSIQGGAGAAGTTSCGVSGASCHRPGTLIDYADGAGGFPTGSAATVTSTLHNTTDALTGPGIDWFCVQKFDATATFAAVSNVANLVAAIIGSATPANLLGTTIIDGVQSAGTAFGGTNWVAFTGSTAWFEQPGVQLGPSGALGVN